MRVLWITNILLPPLCVRLKLPISVFGGWMYSSAKKICEMDSSLQLAVATVYSGKEYQKHEVDGVIYYLLPLFGKNMQKYQKHLEPLWQRVAADYRPDIAHLHGTEYPHSLAFVNANPEVKAVVSIQGLVSVIGRYYLAGLSFKNILYNLTFRDVIRWNNLWQQQRNFTLRGVFEEEVMKRVGHIIGRTLWDKSHAYAIAPDAKYYFCNETLRDEFYRYTWQYGKCEKHTLFLSQAGYPIKGLHYVLQALSLVMRSYPDVKLYVAGGDIRCIDSFEGKIRRGGYGQYILHLIKELRLEDHVVFTGSLTEQQMCEHYLKANVFICSSSIENSPNSLGEAQLMGVPCIASYVGGVPDMMEGYERGMIYRFEEVEMLALLIVKSFSESYDKELQLNPAKMRHDANKNVLRLLEIYNEIIG